MALQVVWSQNASEDLARVLEYLRDSWPQKIADQFLIYLEERIRLISVYPELGNSFEDDETTRKILITKHNAMYYELNEKHIVILKIVDTRSSGYAG